jgi:hypothetical protein
MAMSIAISSGRLVWVVGLLRVQHALGLPGDHLDYQRVLVCEVVVELRFAYAACRHHVAEARSLHAVRVDQIGCGFNNARPARRAACGRCSDSGLRA